MFGGSYTHTSPPRACSSLSYLYTTTSSRPADDRSSEVARGYFSLFCFRESYIIIPYAGGLIADDEEQKSKLLVKYEKAR